MLLSTRAHPGSRRILGSVVAAVLGAAAVPPLAAQKQPTFPTGVELVKVDVVVVDRDGKPVRGLTREEFRVFDEGRERPVASFEAVVAPPPVSADEIRVRPQRVSTNVGEPVRPPRTFLLIVFVPLSPGGVTRSVTALQEFIAANAGLEADVTLASTYTANVWSGRARDLRAPVVFARAISAVFSSAKTAGPLFDPSGLPLFDFSTDPTYVPRWAALQLKQDEVDTARRVVDLIDHVAAGHPGRTTMIVLGEGTLVSHFDRRTKDIAAAAARHRVVIYGLDARGLTAPDLGADRVTHAGDGSSGSRFRLADSAPWAEELALATGGRLVRETARLDVALASFVEESQSYYLLGFEPDASAKPGQLRSIKVQLAKKGYDVRARPAYVVPRPGERSAANAPAGPPLSLRAAAYVRGPGAEGRTAVRLALEVDPASFDSVLGAASDRVTLESQIDVVPLGGGQAQKVEHRSDLKLTPELRRSLADAWVPLARDVEVVPGRYEARVVLRDAGTGRSGTLTHVFEVPAADALRITTPVISDLFRPDGSEREIARVRFDPSREVECAFEALGFATAEDGRARLAAHWTLRSPMGEEVAGGEVKPRKENAAQFAFPLPLAGLAGGEYSLSLGVRDLVSGSAVETEERIEVARSTAAH